MSEQEQTCATCGAWVDGAGCPRRGAADRDVACCYTDEVVQYPHWTPKPAATGLPTLAELDDEIATCGAGWHHTGDMLRAIRPLVEAEECKAAIEAAGYRWIDAQGCKIRVALGSINSSDPLFDDWPAARDWALAQAAAREEDAAKQKARERIAAAGAKLNEDVTVSDGMAWWHVTAADGETYSFAESFTTNPPTKHYFRAAEFAEAHRAKVVLWSAKTEHMGRESLEACAEALGVHSYLATWGRPYVVGAAIALGRYCNHTDRIWLGDGPMPQ